mmetsp:Transcript_1022/g.790  ORF Transcript_1022/g.790 Transcript_1022/m.790 type:complete len:86 (+) Transcript_1022:108-365(+)
MVIKENNELVVFTGCSHNGILNMIDTVVNHFKGIPIKAVIGGFHLVGLPMFNTMAESKSKIEGISKKTLNYSIKKIGNGLKGLIL